LAGLFLYANRAQHYKNSKNIKKFKKDVKSVSGFASFLRYISARKSLDMIILIERAGDTNGLFIT
jgi:hypothetical protein